MDSSARWNEYRESVERYLREIYADCADEPQRVLFDAMEYSLLAGGKRLRPCFALEFCRLCCGQWERALPFAAAVEMVHTYSLIHDDLPCMDNDNYRRGKLTNHKVYGEAMAVLAGDALLTDAFAQAADSRGVPDKNIVAALAVLSECAGSLGMVGGQALDMLSEERVCTEQEVLDIQSRKTGQLLVAACKLGVLAGCGTEDQLQAAAKFGALFGLAFQIRDDLLDVIGSAQELGKATGADAGKNTFVRLYGTEKCARLVEQYTEDAVDALSVFPDRAELAALARSLAARRV